LTTGLGSQAEAHSIRIKDSSVEDEEHKENRGVYFKK